MAMVVEGQEKDQMLRNPSAAAHGDGRGRVGKIIKS